MAVSHDAGFVVCGEHDLRHPANARCPECMEKNPQGVQQSPIEQVEVVYIRGEQE